MANTYEGMFLIDNNLVREGWDGAKSLVTGILEKHGATVVTARRWDERRLAYPIKKRQRATYLLSYFESDGQGMDTMRRDLELTENVLRYLVLSVEAVPEGERELADAERAPDFVVPAPPEDDQEDVRAEQSSDEGGDDSDDDSGDDDSDDAAEKPRRKRKQADDDSDEASDSEAGEEVETASKEG